MRMGVAPSSSSTGYVHPDAARLAAWQRVYGRCLVVEDIYPPMARRFLEARVTTFAELGGGRGPIAALLAAHGTTTCVLDLDEQMLAEAHRPAVRADLRHLPLADRSIDGVAAINCLYFLEEPVAAIAEAHRVLAPGGRFVASSPSRWNDPELEGIDPRWGTPSSFDAEGAPALVGQVFDDVEVEPWSVVAYELPDRAAVADYLHAFNVDRWQERAEIIDVPMTITKVGAEVWARA